MTGRRIALMAEKEFERGISKRLIYLHVRFFLRKFAEK